MLIFQMGQNEQTLREELKLLLLLLFYDLLLTTLELVQKALNRYKLGIL